MQPYQDFSSWQPDQERHFVVFEQRTVESARRAWTIGGLAGAGFFALILIIYFAFPATVNKSEAAGSDDGPDLPSEKVPAAAPAPSPAAAPAAAPGAATAPAAGATADPAAASASAPAAGTASAPAAGTASAPAATTPTMPPPPKGATKAPPTALVGHH